MEFRIAKNEFLRGLRLAQGIADRKSTMPMLANVLLRTTGKKQILVAATDLNVSLTAELKSSNAHEGGITLGAKNLYELIANAPGDDITLKKADNHWAEIKSGKVAYRIVGMPDRDFPKVPDHREAQYSTVESAVLREMIERTLFSVCNDETRFHLNGVYFECDGTQARMSVVNIRSLLSESSWLAASLRQHRATPSTGKYRRSTGIGLQCGSDVPWHLASLCAVLNLGRRLSHRGGVGVELGCLDEREAPCLGGEPHAY